MTKVDVLLGLQWGDEGKGKVVDVLTPNYDAIARFQGGPNAGHSIEFNSIKHVLHTIPSGIFHPSCINIIGNGVVLDPWALLGEIEKLRGQGVAISPETLMVAENTPLILPLLVQQFVGDETKPLKERVKLALPLEALAPHIWTKPAAMALE